MANVIWEMGTIASKDGMNSDTNNTNRMRTVEYLSLSDIASVTANEGYMLLWFAYDKEKKIKGNKIYNVRASTNIIKQTVLNNSISYEGEITFYILSQKKAEAMASAFLLAVLITSKRSLR